MTARIFLIQGKTRGHRPRLQLRNYFVAGVVLFFASLEVCFLAFFSAFLALVASFLSSFDCLAAGFAWLFVAAGGADFCVVWAQAGTESTTATRAAKTIVVILFMVYLRLLISCRTPVQQQFDWTMRTINPRLG